MCPRAFSLQIEPDLEQTSPTLPPAPMAPKPAIALPSSPLSTITTVGPPQYDPVRYYLGVMHMEFTPNFIHTSKCDNCDLRNDSVLQQCNADGFNICKDCMYGPEANRKDGGIHHAPENRLDWSGWRPRSTTTPRRNKTRASKKGFAAIVGKKRRQRKVLSETQLENSLQSSDSGIREPSGDQFAGGPVNGDEEGDGDLFVLDNLIADQDGDTEEDESAMAEDHPLQRSSVKSKSMWTVELCSFKGLRSVEEPMMGLQTDKGFFVPDRPVAYRNVESNDGEDGGADEDTLYQRSNLKRKSVEPVDLSLSKRVRFEIGSNSKPEAGGLPVPGTTDQHTTWGDHNVADDGYGFERLTGGRTRFADHTESELHNESLEENTLSQGQGTHNTRTSVQTRLLDFLTRSWGGSDSRALARYGELLHQEMTRVEDALESAADAELLLGLSYSPESKQG